MTENPLERGWASSKGFLIMHDQCDRRVPLTDVEFFCCIRVYRKMPIFFNGKFTFDMLASGCHAQDIADFIQQDHQTTIALLS